MRQRQLSLPQGEVALSESEGVGQLGRAAEERRALVLVHGSGCNHRFFDGLLTGLAEWPVLAPSLPGRLGSAGPPLTNIAAMAEWLGSFIDALGLREIVLGGHSMGSAVVLELVLERRARLKTQLRGLVLLGAGGQLAVRAAVLRDIRQAVRAGKIPDAGWAMYHPSTPRPIVTAAEALRRQTPTDTTLADWYASNRFDRRARLHEIDLPALIVSGRDDALTPPAYGVELAATLRHPELAILENAGHMFPVEHVAETLQHLRPFLEKLYSMPP